MIGVVFEFANEIVEVRVEGSNVFFRNGNTIQWATIEGLKLDYNGVVKEHPDLEGVDEWKAQAILRFKSKIKSFNSENQRINYIIEDLRKYGYIPKFKQKKGFRPERIV